MMPPLVLRGRYLMREYWSDSALFLRLTAGERELYIGLWMLADDEGWMPRDLEAIGASLYRYMDREPRMALVRAGLARLHDLDKVESHRCGCLHLPAVERYPRAGKKSSEHAQHHREHSNRTKPIKRHSKPSPVPSLPDVVPSSPARAREDGAAGESFAEKVAALGFDPKRVKP